MHIVLNVVTTIKKNYYQRNKHELALASINLVEQGTNFRDENFRDTLMLVKRFLSIITMTVEMMSLQVI